MTDQEIREAIEVPEIAHLWGTPYEITPRFVAEKLGDGGQWIWLSPIMQRPNYWVIRIDSAWDIDDLAEHCDDIYDAIESEYGCTEEEIEQETDEFPYIRIDGGSYWGKYEWKGELH